MGAHPSGPSSCGRGGTQRSLDTVISDNPVAELGENVVARYGDTLPFMLKVLAADQALSIQVHPDREQARRGFAAEEAAGVPVDAPHRNYVDTWPKPEVLVALTEFEVLAGFRAADDAARLLGLLDVPGLAPIIDVLEDGDAQSRKRALALVLEMPKEEAVPLVAEVAAAAKKLAGPHSDDAQSFAAAVRMESEHPGDAGVIASLLLQHSVLQPGEGLFMGAAGPHAYLHGAGIEIMGNSDNVLRAGLTHKHIDVPELLRIVDPTVTVPVLRPAPDKHGVRHYRAPVPEFGLYSVDFTGARVALPGWGPRILLVTEGSLTLADSTGTTLDVSKGDSVFLPASDGEITVLEGCSGQVFVATPGVESTTSPAAHTEGATAGALGGAGHRRGAERRKASPVGVIR